MALCHGCEPGIRTIGSCPIHGLAPRRHDTDCSCQWCLHGSNGGAEALPGIDWNAYETRRLLVEDQTALGVDPAGDAPMAFHTAIPMDQGEPRDSDRVVPGFYRHYDAVSVSSDQGVSSVSMKVDELDRRQITWDIARECPVTAQVVFRLVDGVVVAQLVSYVAFA